MNRMRMTLLIAIFVACRIALAATPATEAGVDQMVAELAKFQAGQPPAGAAHIERFIAATRPGDPLRGRLEGKLVELLGTEASIEARQAAGRVLWVIGTAASLPALERLLADPERQAPVCYALINYPDAGASAALRGALGKAQGPARLPLVNALGDRCDAESVAPLASLARETDPQLARAATRALGMIGTAEAARALEALEGAAGEPQRPAVKLALLQCAQRLAATGDRAVTEPIFKKAYADAAPLMRRAGLIGLIGLGGPAATDVALAAVRGEDSALAATAAAQIPTLRDPAAGAVLVRELKNSSPAAQRLLIQALAARGETQARPAIAELAGGADTKVAAAALKALGRIGDAAAVPVLIGALNRRQPAANVQAALESLRRLKGEGVTEAIVQGAGQAVPEARAELFEVLVTRQASAAVPLLIEQAGVPERPVRVAAFKALIQLAGPAHLPAVARLAAASAAKDAPDQAETALARVARKLPNPDQASGAILAAYPASPAPAERCSLLRVLGRVGGPKALAVTVAAAADPEPAVRSAARRALAQWPESGALEPVMTLAEKTTDPLERVLLLRGALRLLTLPAKRTAEQDLDAYARALRLAPGAEEKCAALAGLAQAPTAAALELVAPLLDEPAVRVEAAQAVLKLVAGHPGNNPERERAILDKVLAGASDPALKQEASRLREAVAAPPKPAGAPVALFDGQTFNGWEGDTQGSFRIQDGAIVGGSLKAPVPHNRYLCTTKRYRNFEFRVKFKLLGENVNAGVQFRSDRVAGSGEMVGYQADAGQHYWGSLYDERRHKLLTGPAPETQQKLFRPADWNEYVVRAEGRRVQMWLNGTKTVDYLEPDATIPQEGVFGVQIHMGGPSEAWYRDLAIVELP